MSSSEGRGSGPFRSLGRIRRKGLTRGAIIGWFAALLGAASGASALGDNSFFTHLSTGRRILDGHLPSTDPYSFTAHGHPWVIQSWFASLLYGLGDGVGHGMGIRLMVALLSALLCAALAAPAAAQYAPRREAQIGPRPFYLVDKMKAFLIRLKLAEEKVETRVCGARIL